MYGLGFDQMLQDAGQMNGMMPGQQPPMQRQKKGSFSPQTLSMLSQLMMGAQQQVNPQHQNAVQSMMQRAMMGRGGR